MMPTKLGILEDQKYTASNLAYHTIFSLNNYYTMYVLIKYAGSNFLYRILYHFHMTKKIWPAKRACNRNISEELRPEFDQD